MCEKMKKNLEEWLRERNMQTVDLAKITHLSRVTIWKVKKGLPISEESAFKIIRTTSGEVHPKTNEKRD